MAFKMNGWSAFKQLIPTTKNNLRTKKKETEKPEDTGAAGSAGKNIIKKTQAGKLKKQANTKRDKAKVTKSSKKEYVPQTTRKEEGYSPQSQKSDVWNVKEKKYEKK